MPRHHAVQRGRSTAGIEVGIAGGPDRTRAADVEPWGTHAGGIYRAQAALDAADRAGTHRHPGVSAKYAGEPGIGDGLRVSAIGIRRGPVSIQRLRGMPQRPAGAGRTSEEPEPDRNRRSDVESPGQHEATIAQPVAGGDAATARLYLGAPVFSRGGKRRGGEKSVRREELRHLSRRPVERRARTGQEPGRLFGYHDGFRLVAAWAGNAGPDEAAKYLVAAVHSTADGRSDRVSSLVIRNYPAF